MYIDTHINHHCNIQQFKLSHAIQTITKQQNKHHTTQFPKQSSTNYKISMIQTITYPTLQSYYSSPITSRYQVLLHKFTQHYQSKPDYISRAPGRVNIIGQHIDYEGYGVLPAAIEKDCLIAFKAVKSQTIDITHILQQQFPSCSLSKYPDKIWESVTYPFTKYFAAGYRAGLLELSQDSEITGLQILIEGNIPWASGISSSSAFCVCSAMVAYFANKTKSITKEQFVQRCIKFQREVGTASGGMDQSISYLGQKNTCLYIQFNPIRAQKVEVPLQNHKLIIMNSLVQSPKMQTAVYRYNKRVCQCRIATHVLAKNLNIPSDVYGKWRILKQLQQHLKFPLVEMLSIVDQHLPRKDYTQTDLETELGVPLINIIGDIQRAQDVLNANKHYKIYEAAYHVYAEANRVLEFIEVCHSQKSSEEKVEILGDLMNKSQASCRDLYECSCPELEELTTLARKNGALGSRLTGAGWGGCTVSVVPIKCVQSFIQTITQQYYNKPEIKSKISNITDAIFSTQPGQGAFIIDLNA